MPHMQRMGDATVEGKMMRAPPVFNNQARWNCWIFFTLCRAKGVLFRPITRNLTGNCFCDFLEERVMDADKLLGVPVFAEAHLSFAEMEFFRDLRRGHGNIAAVHITD